MTPRQFSRQNWSKYTEISSTLIIIQIKIGTEEQVNIKCLHIYLQKHCFLIRNVVGADHFLQINPVKGFWHTIFFL